MSRRRALLGVVEAVAASGALTGSGAAAPKADVDHADSVDTFDAGQIRALASDVQRTTLDGYTPLLVGINRAFESKGIDVVVDPFIAEWRTGYRTVIDAILAGTRPWVPTELVYASASDALLDQHSIGGRLSEPERAALSDLWARH